MTETSLTDDDRQVRAAWVALRDHLELVGDLDERLEQVIRALLGASCRCAIWRRQPRLGVCGLTPSSG